MRRVNGTKKKRSTERHRPIPSRTNQFIQELSALIVPGGILAAVRPEPKRKGCDIDCVITLKGEGLVSRNVQLVHSVGLAKKLNQQRKSGKLHIAFQADHPRPRQMKAILRLLSREIAT